MHNIHIQYICKKSISESVVAELEYLLVFLD